LLLEFLNFGDLGLGPRRRGVLLFGLARDGDVVAAAVLLAAGVGLLRERRERHKEEDRDD
jgi:hypothetical protein